MKKILVCEDEAAIRDFVVINLTRAGYDVVEADCGEAALKKYEENDGDFDIAILDVMMPGINGFEVCKELRNRNGGIGIIMLSAKTQEMDKVTGLMTGADDYVTKPFSLPVLYAKLTALINRRRGSILSGNTLTAGAVRLELSSRQVFVQERPVALTPKEYALLLCLLQNRNAVLSREQLLVKCWGYDYEGEARAVDTHIRRLRDKLGTAAELIKTVIKSGYKLEV